MFAAYARTLHKSTDGGDTWQTIRDFKNQINDLAIEPTTGRVFVAALGEGIFRTDNVSPSLVQIAPGSTFGPTAIAVSASTLYYANSDRSFFRSTNDGQSWSRQAFTPDILARMVVDPANPNLIVGASYSLMMRSTDGGATWGQSTIVDANGTTPNGVADVVMLSQSKIAMCTNSGVFATSDSGSTWSRMLPNAQCVSLLFDPTTPGALVASLATYPNASLYRSSDGGLTANPIGTLSFGTVNGVAIAGTATSNTFVALNSNGAFRSLSNGTSWVPATKSPNASSPFLAATAGQNAKAYAFVPNTGFSSNTLYSYRNAEWQKINTPSTYYNAVFATRSGQPNVLYLGSGTIYRSTDSGSTWQIFSNAFSQQTISAIATDPKAPLTMYVKASDNANWPNSYIYKSSDGGQTWLRHSITSFSDYGKSILLVDPSNSDHLYVGTRIAANASTGLHESIDGGVNWIPRLTEEIRDIAIDPTNSAHILVATSSGLMMSNNAAASFELNSQFAIITNQTPSAVVFDPAVPTTIYATSIDTSAPLPVQRNSYVLRSVDNGASWEQLHSESDASNMVALSALLDPNSPAQILVSNEARGVAAFEVAPDLSLTISGHSGPRPVGARSSFDVRAINTGPFAATLVRVTIFLPTAVSEVTATSDRGACGLAGGNIVCTINVLKPNEFANINVTYIPTKSAMLAISTDVSAHERDVNGSNNFAQASATAGEVVDLAVTLTPSVTAASNEDVVTYTLNVVNNGPVNASNAIATFSPGRKLALRSPPPDCAISGATLVCNTGSIASGATRSFSISASISEPGLVAAAADIVPAVSATDTNAANNTAYITIDALPTGDLSVAISSSAETVPVSTNFDYRALVLNAGPNDMPNVSVNLVGSGTTIGINPSQGSCTSSPTGASCALGTIAANASATIIITSASSSAGSISLQASVTSSGTDRVINNNAAQKLTTVQNTSTGQESGGGNIDLRLLVALSILLTRAWLIAALAARRSSQYAE